MVQWGGTHDQDVIGLNPAVCVGGSMKLFNKNLVQNHGQVV